MTLSVIIPVYNCEPFLERCLCSLLNQNRKDFEIIIVDDGSSDGSFAKIVSLLEKKNHCTILAQTNKGASAARNTGLQHATGEWITFVDSDDYLASDYLETLMGATTNVDFVVSGVSFCKGGKEYRRLIPPKKEWTLSDLKQGHSSYLDYTVWPVGKLYRKEILNKYDIQFDENLTSAEDRDFNIEYLARVETIRYIHYAGYYYHTDHEGSLSKASPINPLHTDILYWRKLYRLLDGTNEDYLAHRLFFFIIDAVVGHTQRREYFAAVNALKNARAFVDRTFLRQHLNRVKAPAWQKWLIRIILL